MFLKFVFIARLKIHVSQSAVQQQDKYHAQNAKKQQLRNLIIKHLNTIYYKIYYIIKTTLRATKGTDNYIGLWPSVQSHHILPRTASCTLFVCDV